MRICPLCAAKSTCDVVAFSGAGRSAFRMRCLSSRCSLAGPVRATRSDAVAAFRALAGPRALVQARVAGMREGFAIANDFAAGEFPSGEAETALERRLLAVETFCQRAVTAVECIAEPIAGQA
jgi:hypothetical protein